MKEPQVNPSVAVSPRSDINSRVLKTEPVEWRKLSWLQGQLKSITKDSFRRLKESLVKNQFIQPFNVWENGEIWILDGHHRLKAMQELEKEGHSIPDVLPANFVQCRDAKEAKKLVLVYSSIYAKIDEESLYEFLQTNELDFDDLKMEIDLPDINLPRFEQGWMTDEVVEDEAPEVPVVPKSKLGDLYEMGRHRLLCGDSTNAEDVVRLMQGAIAVLYATDPPYGIDYSNSGTNSSSLNGIWEDIKFDDLRDSKLKDFLENAFRAWLPFLKENAAWYLWHAHLTQGFFSAAAAAADVILHRQIIWEKSQLIMGMGFFHWQHEPCFMGWRKGHRPPWYGDRTQTTVWKIAYEPGTRNKGDLKMHPTQKPCEIFVRPIRYHTREGEIVAEPFAGSGSQIIAAEQTGRSCHAMELEPRYVDVCVSRWCKFTGRNRIKLNGQGITWAS